MYRQRKESMNLNIFYMSVKSSIPSFLVFLCFHCSKLKKTKWLKTYLVICQTFVRKIVLYLPWIIRSTKNKLVRFDASMFYRIVWFNIKTRRNVFHDRHNKYVFYHAKQYLSNFNYVKHLIKCIEISIRNIIMRLSERKSNNPTHNKSIADCSNIFL